MHPDVESPIRELAREFVLGEIGERGRYCKAAEAGRISFDDIYFMGVVNGVEAFSLDLVAQGDDNGVLGEEPAHLVDSINGRSINLISKLYGCSPFAVQERLGIIHTKVNSCSD